MGAPVNCGASAQADESGPLVTEPGLHGEHRWRMIIQSPNETGAERPGVQNGG